jgi:hypothetical protein
MPKIVHQLERTDLVTGHVVLSCPVCEYAVKFEPGTLKKTTLNWGDAETIPHVYGDFAGIGLSESKSAAVSAPT